MTVHKSASILSKLHTQATTKVVRFFFAQQRSLINDTQVMTNENHGHLSF